MLQVNEITDFSFGISCGKEKRKVTHREYELEFKYNLNIFYSLDIFKF